MPAYELNALYEGKEKNATIITTAAKDETIASPKKQRPKLRQLLATSSAISCSISFGMTNGFTGTLLPQITHLTQKTMESWLAGTVAISMIFGVLLSSFLMRKYGRRKSQIVGFLPFLMGWPCMATAESIWIMLLGCFLVGFAGGLLSTISNVYVIESCAPNMRSLIGVFVSIGVATGILLTHVLGILLPWRTSLLVSVLFPVVAFGLAFIAPETPNWLILQGRLKEAKENFFWLRGNGEEAQSEFSKLLDKQTCNVEHKSRGVISDILSRDFLKPFSVLCILFTAQQGSGLNMISFYAIKLLREMSPSLNPEMATMQLDTIRLAACVISIYCVKAVPRRKLFFISAVGTILSLLAIIYLMETKCSDNMLLAAIGSYLMFVYTGVLPVPWLLSGELYPSSVRDVGTASTTVYGFFIIFLVLKFSPLLMDLCGVSITLAVYGSIVLVCSVVLYPIMPETRNIPLAQIEEKMRSHGNKKSRVHSTS